MKRDMAGASSSTHLADPANDGLAATAARLRRFPDIGLSGHRRLKGWLHTSQRSPDVMQHPGAASLIGVQLLRVPMDPGSADAQARQA
jgi:hypothetical protein